MAPTFGKAVLVAAAVLALATQLNALPYYGECKNVPGEQKILLGKDGIAFNATVFDWIQYEGEEDFFLYPKNASNVTRQTNETEVNLLLKQLNSRKHWEWSCADYTREFAKMLAKKKIDFWTALSREGGEAHAFVAVNVSGRLVPVEPQANKIDYASVVSRDGYAFYGNAMLFKWGSVKKCVLKQEAKAGSRISYNRISSNKAGYRFLD
jgi:hypothetical protein